MNPPCVLSLLLQYFNVNELLAQSIVTCEYFLALHEYATFQEVYPSSSLGSVLFVSLVYLPFVG